MTRLLCNLFAYYALNSIIKVYVQLACTDDGNPHSLVETQQKERIDQIIQHYNEASRQMDAAKEIEKTLAGQESGRETNFWWEAPIDQLNLQQLEELEFRYAKQINELYNARNKKIAGTTNTNDHVAASFFPDDR
ncbi:hypothetical protein V6N13_027115 [Hibiscus sabdariffa]|uniref:Uncharacterized protein n=1 Tax=Hibiscus sabdariffa TaxID=183260 RepID=A0ABR1ZP89_9ROSI